MNPCWCTEREHFSPKNGINASTSGGMVEDAAMTATHPQALPCTPTLIELEAKALLTRSAGQDRDPYERVMRSCLSAAQSALASCPPGPLLDRFAQELGDLARHCAEDAERAQEVFRHSPDAQRRHSADAARRVAAAARDLCELARVKALDRA